MKCVALCALASGLALLVVSPAAFTADRGPFTLVGGVLSLGTRSDGIDTGNGGILGCVPGGRLAQAITVQNRTKHAVTLTAATGKPDRAPLIWRRIATQLRLLPKPRPVTGGGIPYMRRWSASRGRPVAIPPGRQAVVQSNFRMGRCQDLAGGRTLVVPGGVVLRYRTARATGSVKWALPDARLILFQEAAVRSCGPRVKGGSASIVAANMNCRAARNVALACQRTSYGLGTCRIDEKVWDCSVVDGDLKLAENCWLSRNESHWFRVDWHGHP